MIIAAHFFFVVGLLGIGIIGGLYLCKRLILDMLKKERDARAYMRDRETEHKFWEHHQHCVHEIERIYQMIKDNRHGQAQHKFR